MKKVICLFLLFLFNKNVYTGISHRFIPTRINRVLPQAVKNIIIPNQIKSFDFIGYHVEYNQITKNPLYTSHHILWDDVLGQEKRNFFLYITY